MAVKDKLVSAEGVKAVHNYTQAQISALKPLDAASREEAYEPVNFLDPNKVSVGSIQTSTGNLYPSSTSYRATDFIPVKKGDKVYLSGVSASDTRIYAAGAIGAICEYDADKTFISGKYASSTNGYEVSDDNAAYVRLSYAITGSFGTAKIVSVTKNWLPAYAGYIMPYAAPGYVTAVEKAGAPVKMHIIDCWGDSRTAGSESFVSYLQTLLGTGYCLVNYGTSSQASGMITARLGSNDIYVTLENNHINAEGSTNVTDIAVSSGKVYNYFCFNANAAPVCSINGVRGMLYKIKWDGYSDGGTTKCAFVRETAGAQVDVIPHTKADFTDKDSRNHLTILWMGKNDMLTSNYGRAELMGIYEDAVNHLGHDKFILLGETMSVNDPNQYYDPDYSTHVLYDFVTEFNAAMAAKYPNNFIDINKWLASTEALSSVSLTAGTEDTAYIAKNWPAYQLMKYSTDTNDYTHPSAKGQEAIAKRVYAFMQAKGWA